MHAGLKKLRADFHEGRDFRKNILYIKKLLNYTQNTKTKKEELLYRQQDEPILSVCLINSSLKRT
jgi:ribosomal protein S15P/S13E